MGAMPPLLTFLLMVISGWAHRRQLTVIEFLQAENRLLKGRLSGKRIRFTDAERALLARKAKAVGRKAPLEVWMLQAARNLNDEDSGALASKRYLTIDQDTKYTQQFRRLVEEGGSEVIRLPWMSPNLNAFAERFVRSIKEECLRRMIFIG